MESVIIWLLVIIGIILFIGRITFINIFHHQHCYEDKLHKGDAIFGMCKGDSDFIDCVNCEYFIGKGDK